MTITTSTTLPPFILQKFSRSLLSIPCPKFRDHPETLICIYRYIEKKLRKKTLKNEKRNNKYIGLSIEFMELYERAKAKEKELEKETKHITQQPFYFFGGPDKRYQNIFKRLRFKR